MNQLSSPERDATAPHVHAWPQTRVDAGRYHPLLRQCGFLQDVDVEHQCLAIQRGYRQVPLVFAWSAGTEFRRHGEPISPADLKQGERVNILYNKERSQLLAKTIMVHRQQKTSSVPHVPETKPC